MLLVNKKAGSRGGRHIVIALSEIDLEKLIQGLGGKSTEHTPASNVHARFTWTQFHANGNIAFLVVNLSSTHHQLPKLFGRKTGQRNPLCCFNLLLRHQSLRNFDVGRFSHIRYNCCLRRKRKLTFSRSVE